MCNELYQIKRILTAHDNGLLSKEQAASKCGEGELGDSSYGKRMKNYIHTEDTKSLLRWVVRELDHTCVHEWINDEIDLPDGSIKKIKYCCHCENNFN